VDADTDLKGKKLADEVNKQSWDPSVKALAQFPSVLANMDKNLSWSPGPIPRILLQNPDCTAEGGKWLRQ
jgi:hypothetical protein